MTSIETILYKVGTHYYFYDAENRLVQVDGTLGTCASGSTTGTTACYYYDAEGHRVHRTGIGDNDCLNDGNGGVADFAFDLDGHWTTRTNTSGGGCSSDIYIAGSHFGSVTDGMIFFDHTDWLGTSRLRNTATYPTKYYESCTSLPFGDGLSCNSTYASNIHFTGKEHDFESGLDNFGARYNSSNLGRFMSPDPSNISGDTVDSENPQAWNLYPYVSNNPLSAIDADGLDFYLIGGDQCGQNGIQCDKQGYVLDNNGNRAVVTDEQINGSNGLAKVDANGNLQINTAQGTFQGEFFDPHQFSVTVTPSFEEQKFMVLEDAGGMATPGVNAAMAITAPQLIFMGGATLALSGAGSTLTLEAGEMAGTPGELTELSIAARQGGKAGVRKLLRSFLKRLAKHQADLARYQSQGGYTSHTVGEIEHFQRMIRLAEDWLIKNP